MGMIMFLKKVILFLETKRKGKEKLESLKSIIPPLKFIHEIFNFNIGKFYNSNFEIHHL